MRAQSTWIGVCLVAFLAGAAGKGVSSGPSSLGSVRGCVVRNIACYCSALWAHEERREG